MRKSLLLAFITVSALSSYAQVGIGTSTPNSHAVLDLKSPTNNQGLLIPNLSTVQRTATALTSSLSSSDNGLLVYDSDDKKFYVWKDTAWIIIVDGSVTGAGTVTSVGTGTGLTGGPITGTGTISLANTAVTAGGYGDATHVAQVAVDAQGRITNATSVPISGIAPSGLAGGDLTGSYPNPTLATGAVTPAKLAAGDYSSKINSGTYAIGISGNAATATTAATATNFSGALAGDVTGTQGATSVTKIQGSAVSATAPTANQILKWNGTSWLPSADANSGGTVTSITTSARLTGGPITTTGALDLATSGVSAATYGSATQVAQIAVDTYGRVTSATNVSIAGASGSASGDLAGTYPAPTIATGAGNDIVAAVNNGSTTSTVNTNRLNASVVLDSESPAAGDISGNFGAGLQLNTGSVTTAEILDGTVATADIATTAVTDAKIASGITASKISPSGSNGQVLTTVGGATTWAPANPGTVTNVATGTGLTGGPITGTGTIGLANTAVTAGGYGDATHVAQITVDGQGRITNAVSTTITGAAPTGSAGGDLTGNYPNPTILANAVTAAKIAAGDYSSKINAGTYTIGITGNAATATSATTATTATNFSGALAGDVTGTQAATSVTKIQGSAVSATAPTANQILKWNGTSWLPSADANSGGTVTSVATGTGLSGGPVTGTGTISLANTAVTAGGYGDGTHVAQITVDGQGRITNAVSTTITGAAPTGPAGGDLTGNFPNPTILANAVTAAKIAAGDYSSKINAGTYAIGITGNAATATTATNFSGSLAGDVTGTQAATSVTKIQGSAVSATAPTNNQILKWNGSSWLPSADANSGGTVTSVASGTGLTGGPITGTGTLSLANTAVTIGTYGTGTQVPQITVDAQGRITSASNVAISGLPPSGTAGGDLSGTYPNPAVGTGAITSAKIFDGAIVDADINAAAAIVDSKLATISTAGKVVGNAITSGVIQGSTSISTTGTIVSAINSSGNSALFSNSTATTSSVVKVSSAGTGYALETEQPGSSGSSLGAYITNPANASPTIYGYSAGTGYSIIGVAQGTGTAIYGTTGAAASYGIQGSNNSGATGGTGIFGTSSSPNGFGIVGTSTYAPNPGGTGVSGTSVGFAGTGVNAVATGGRSIGLYASGVQYGGYFTSAAGGAIYANGPAGGTTAWTGPSDRRYKKNILTLPQSLEKILSLRGVNFDWREDEFPDMKFDHQRQIGFIAQEIKEILPEVVSVDTRGYYRVAYDRVVPVLVEAIKAQQKIIDEQKEKIEKLEKTEAAFADRLAAIESRLKGQSAPTLTAKKNEK